MRGTCVVWNVRLCTFLYCSGSQARSAVCEVFDWQEVRTIYAPQGMSDKREMGSVCSWVWSVCVCFQWHVTAAAWGRCEQKKVAGGGGLFQSWLLKEMECHSVGSMNVKSEGSKDGGVWCSSDHGGHDRSGKRRFCGNMGGFMYYLIMQRVEQVDSSVF